MTARDYLIKTDLNIRIAIQNGYDIRLDESEILEKMEGYHQAKLKLLNICIISDGKQKCKHKTGLFTHTENGHKLWFTCGDCKEIMTYEQFKKKE